MKKTIVAITVASGLLASVNASLLTNGDLEADGYTAEYTAETISDNYVTSISGWIGNYTDGNLRLEFDNGGRVPAYDNTVARMQGGNWVRQNFSTGWVADDTFTVSFNACEVWWRAGGTDQNSMTVSLMDNTGATAYQTKIYDLDGTHGGETTTYEDWTADQTFSFQVTGQNLVDAGATAGDELIIQFDSVNINYLDNVSVIPEPATLGLVAVFGGGILFIRRRFKR